MIYKYMYCGFSDDEKVELLKNSDIVTSSAAYYPEEKMIFVYYEAKNGNVGIDDVVKGNMKKFPDGKDWCRMIEVFHYFTPLKDEEWTRKVANKTAEFRINKFYYEKVASYIMHHQQLEKYNLYNCDKFFSIFTYNNIGIIYGENPVEKITWAELEGRPHQPDIPEWGAMMNEHFAEWPDGHKGWVKLSDAKK